VLGGAVYFGIVFALFGRQWLAVLKRRAETPPPTMPERD
jgi:hypothetical protein